MEQVSNFIDKSQDQYSWHSDWQKGRDKRLKTEDLLLLYSIINICLLDRMLLFLCPNCSRSKNFWFLYEDLIFPRRWDVISKPSGHWLETLIYDMSIKLLLCIICFTLTLLPFHRHGG
jgi:hypothetical protein